MSHPRLIGLFSPPVRASHKTKKVDLHVLLVIQHMYESAHLQILMFLHSVENFATRMGGGSGTHLNDEKWIATDNQQEVLLYSSED